MSARQDPSSWARECSPRRSFWARDSETDPFAGRMVALGSSLTTNTGVLIEPRRAAGVERLP